MITSWELIMAAHTSWHSSEAASGEKQKQGEEQCQPLPLLNDERTHKVSFYFDLCLGLEIIRNFAVVKGIISTI